MQRRKLRGKDTSYKQDNQHSGPSTEPLATASISGTNIKKCTDQRKQNDKPTASVEEPPCGLKPSQNIQEEAPKECEVSLFDEQYGNTEGSVINTKMNELYTDLSFASLIASSSGAIETSKLEKNAQSVKQCATTTGARFSRKHQRLLYKLSSTGIRDDLLDWIRAFLVGRKQRVCIGDDMSEWVNVTTSVPQGSVLGPLLFILYVNDSLHELDCGKIMSADDVKL
ncbi:hypothetical protein SprV_0100401600 [Sparganum proliferum]